MMSEFESAFERYHRDMYRSVRRSGVPHERAEDAVQEAAKRLSQMNTIQYMDPGRTRGLFCKVAINCGRTIMSKNGHVNKMHEEYGDAVATTTQSISRKEKETVISITVHRALSQLPELDSYLAWKYYALEMSLREIAEDLQVDKGMKWDHVRIHRHLKKVVKPALKAALETLGGDTL
jgi:RNA polymerase sigma factor (sigma-70 family)